MLEFYYDFLSIFYYISKLEYVEMDTDSAEILKPNMNETFRKEKHFWFPHDDTE